MSVGHIYAFLLSHYTFSSRAWILRCQSWHLGESLIYHSPSLMMFSDLGGHPINLLEKLEYMYPSFTFTLRCREA